MPVDIDETPYPFEAALDYVERMADEKAQAAFSIQAEGSLEDLVILAADTTVVSGRKILGKPRDFDDFANMMRSLSGQKHQVFTAVSMIKKSADQVLRRQHVNESSVQFCVLSEADIHWYWQTAEPEDKAGGYGIQGQGARFVQSIHGSYSGIMGLPLYETAEILIDFGILSQN